MRVSWKGKRDHPGAESRVHHTDDGIRTLCGIHIPQQRTCDSEGMGWCARCDRVLDARAKKSQKARQSPAARLTLRQKATATYHQLKQDYGNPTRYEFIQAMQNVHGVTGEQAGRAWRIIKAQRKE